VIWREFPTTKRKKNPPLTYLLYVFAGQLSHEPLWLYSPAPQTVAQSDASLDPAGAVLEPEHGVHEVRAAVPLPNVFAGQ